jgi:transglutaminase-like putative cysteine protease
MPIPCCRMTRNRPTVRRPGPGSRQPVFCMRPTRRLRIRHTTRYTYDTPVKRSLHRLHLRPVIDWRQNLLSYGLTIRPQVPVIEFEDVFGNWAQRFEIDKPYTELGVTAESLVEVVDTDPFAFAKLPIHPPSWPLVWMPWERTMLAAYLTPAELPEPQLQALYDYGMQFVNRNHGDLMETLFAINLTLFREYRYVPGDTDLHTSAFEVFQTRTGVCQDFANLFITIARLLGIPARYVCGYIFTGAAGNSRAASDATHAWVELYIPNIGWKGFDPTNGVLPQTDHVRVAVGRHFRDATPTAGTLFTRANETMTVEVEVTDAIQDREPSVLRAS